MSKQSVRVVVGIAIVLVVAVVGFVFWLAGDDS